MCLRETQVCCETREDGFICRERDESCGRGNIRHECDETRDCLADEVCCYGRLVARCARECVTGEDKLCSDDSECESGDCILGGTCRGTAPDRFKAPSIAK